LHAFVQSLDLRRLGFEYLDLGAAGRPPYHPATMLLLLLYGALGGMNSVRQLARACREDTVLARVLGGARPTFKTVANFRNRAALAKVNRKFAVVCRQNGWPTVDIAAGAERWPRAEQQNKPRS